MIVFTSEKDLQNVQKFRCAYLSVYPLVSLNLGLTTLAQGHSQEKIVWGDFENSIYCGCILTRLKAVIKEGD